LKPELDTRYNAYVQQRRKEQAEARKRQEDQARQVKLRKSAYVEDKTQVDEEERVPQPWSLQDELRGVVGVGSHAEAFQRYVICSYSSRITTNNSYSFDTFPSDKRHPWHLISNILGCYKEIQVTSK
jgi:hypothetical protein